MKVLSVAALIVILAGLFGWALASLDEDQTNRDYQRGYYAGYVAREQIYKDQDAKLQMAGLCVYARLACRGAK